MKYPDRGYTEDGRGERGRRGHPPECADNDKSVAGAK